MPCDLIQWPVWNLLSFMQGKVRKATLVTLGDGAKTPSGIADATGEHLSHVSRALSELSGKGLVECVTPSRSKNRIYRITDDGQQVLIELKKL